MIVFDDGYFLGCIDGEGELSCNRLTGYCRSKVIVGVIVRVITIILNRL